MIVPSFPRSARAWCLALALLASWAARLALPPFAVASETVRLYTSFSPDRPGASTTITFGFTIGSSNGQVPSPLTSVNLHLPAGIGLARNGLGTAICEPSELYEEGPPRLPCQLPRRLRLSARRGPLRP
ncbi:MAG TPA: hypothetical protein VGY76_06410 [Solirubrobacteraceae bacterium]|nr:hypothetical protein [Solirubrobacteraceae bacterium]